MDVLIVGSGGREHALAHALHRDAEVARLYVAPGNAGTTAIAESHQVAVTDPDAVAGLAEKLAVDLVVIGPEAPLVAGVADGVRARGISCFGPSAAAARLEGSKAFAKDMMAAAGVPTAMAHVCDGPELAAHALDAFGPPYVVKADGLTSGKGVVVTADRDEALAHARRCGQVVIEEYLDGPEMSLLCLVDGRTVVPLVPAQDFKRVGDKDTGPNTGGMGAYAPLPWAPADLVDDVVDRIIRPTAEQLIRQRSDFSGLLYAGLAHTSRGPRVVEFNARFGDPEAQAVLPLLRTPLASVLHAVATGQLTEAPPLVWDRGAAVTVVVAADGYPTDPHAGARIDGLDEVAGLESVELTHAGTALDQERNVVVAGGRVLAVTGTGEDLLLARDRAYDAVARLRVEGGHHRRDIALDAAHGDVALPGSE